MSTVELLVKKRHSLLDDDMIATGIKLPENTEIIGIVRSDFEPEEGGIIQSSDDIEPVLDLNTINYLTGQILTLVEATIADPDQRKAAKDMFKQTVWGWYTGYTNELSRAWRRAKGYEINKPLKED